MGAETLEDWPELDPLTAREVDILLCIADGLPDREIAQKLSLSPETVKWYNKRIYSKLGVNNRTQAASQAKSLGLLDESASTATAAVRLPNNLPAQVTSFVGRKRELAETQHLLEQTRLMTLSGMPGSGKTRLALQLASVMLPAFRDGAYFVPLTPVNEAKNILWAVAEHVGMRFHPEKDPLSQLLDHFQRKKLLLVLDNFEHLLDGAHYVTDILKAAPGVKAIVTSREHLRLYGETNYVVGGLLLPDIGDLENAYRTEAVQLFMQCAKAAEANLTLDAFDLSQVIRICHLVGGMPLGIELAATWVDTLSPREIADELEQSLDILEVERRDVPNHQNSMRAAFARSWNLLDDQHQVAFRKLSVFRGGFTRHAARTVIGVAFPTLQDLVSKSLLQFDPETRRYQTHELLRSFAQEQLELSGESEEVSSGHASYFAGFLAELWLRMKGPQQKFALLDLEADIENVRAAWGYWIRKGNVHELKKFFHGLWVFHDIRGWYPAGIELFERAIQLMRSKPGEEAQAGLGWLLAAQGLYSVAGGMGPRIGFAQAREGVEILRRLNYYDAGAVPLISLFITAIEVNDKQVASQAAEECLQVATRVGDQWGIAKAKQLLAIRAIDEQHFDQADQLGHEALEIFETNGDNWSASVLCIEVMGLLAITQRDFDIAKQWIEHGLRAAEEIDFKYSLQMAYWQLGFVEALQEHYSSAAAYWHKALGIGERVVGGKSIIGFGGSHSVGEWGGRELIGG